MAHTFNVLEIRDNSIAKAIAVVRNTGATNMFFLDNVLDIMRQLDYKDEVDYLETHRDDYLRLLNLSEKY